MFECSESLGLLSFERSVLATPSTLQLGPAITDKGRNGKPSQPTTNICPF